MSLIKIGKKIISTFSKIIRDHKEKYCENSIVYFPRFNSIAELTNHYHRACWYIPRLKGKCDSVYMFQKIGTGINAGERPSYMCTSITDTSHILIKKGFFAYLKTLFISRLILVHKNYSPFFWNFLKIIGIQAVNVDTEDLYSKEYGAYCGLIWRNILNQHDRDVVTNENYQRFVKISKEIHKKNYARSCVFGTGPSLEKAFDFDFNGCLTITCNSIVQNSNLLDHIEPDFICAGDVVSHLGVSLYAETFRRDLINTLLNRNVIFVTTAAFGYLLLLNHPEIKDKIILIPQVPYDPNCNLLKCFGLPSLDSTLNIHMLPLATTFSDEIFILGCDGKSPKQNNEDFWGHFSKAQYHDLVYTGHKCHPTFDIHRQQSTFNKYVKSVEISISLGENKYGKKFWTLSPSHTPTLDSRQFPQEWVQPETSAKIKIHSFPARQIMATDAKILSSVTASGLPVRCEIKQILSVRDNMLLLKGWFLSSGQIDSIEIYADNNFMGNGMPYARPDLYTKHPEYHDLFCGFKLYISIKLLHLKTEFLIKFCSNNEVIYKLQQKIISIETLKKA